jgi:3-dehydroquinate dehydratase-2
MKKILVLNGPNLNLLGCREVNYYGADNLNTIETNLQTLASQYGYNLDFFQSNHEGELIDTIQQAKNSNVAAIIINPAAYTHTSVAIRDALLAVDIKFIEVHISNVFQRESFRHQSFFSDIAIGTISGLGSQVYELAFLALVKILATAR